MNLQHVLQRPDVWRGSKAPATAAIASGFAALDRLLPGGGWPLGAVTEIQVPRTGIGELRLLLPALARLSRGDRWIVIIAPPYVLYAPALRAAGVELSRILLVHPRARADHGWAIESSLRSSACIITLSWLEDVTAANVRRWQLAAEEGGTCGVLFPARPVSDSPAALRLQLAPAGNALDVHIAKRRGGWPFGPVRLEIDHAMALPAAAGSCTPDLQTWHAR